MNEKLAELIRVKTEKATLSPDEVIRLNKIESIIQKRTEYIDKLYRQVEEILKPAVEKNQVTIARKTKTLIDDIKYNLDDLVLAFPNGEQVRFSPSSAKDQSFITRVTVFGEHRYLDLFHVCDEPEPVWRYTIYREHHDFNEDLLLRILETVML